MKYRLHYRHEHQCANGVPLVYKLPLEVTGREVEVTGRTFCFLEEWDERRKIWVPLFGGTAVCQVPDNYVRAVGRENAFFHMLKCVPEGARNRVRGLYYSKTRTVDDYDLATELGRRNRVLT